MNTKNIQLSIIAALLFTLNVLFYYFFNQIAFIINYSNRSYTTEHFASHQSIKVPILTAEVYSLLFPILRPAGAEAVHQHNGRAFSLMPPLALIGQFNTVVRSYKFRHDAFFILVGQTRKGQLLCL